MQEVASGIVERYLRLRLEHINDDAGSLKIIGQSNKAIGLHKTSKPGVFHLRISGYNVNTAQRLSEIIGTELKIKNIHCPVLRLKGLGKPETLSLIEYEISGKKPDEKDIQEVFDRIKLELRTESERLSFTGRKQNKPDKKQGEIDAVNFIEQRGKQNLKEMSIIEKAIETRLINLDDGECIFYKGKPTKDVGYLLTQAIMDRLSTLDSTAEATDRVIEMRRALNIAIKGIIFEIDPNQPPLDADFLAGDWADKLTIAIKGKLSQIPATSRSARGV